MGDEKESMQVKSAVLSERVGNLIDKVDDVLHVQEDFQREVRGLFADLPRMFVSKSRYKIVERVVFGGAAFMLLWGMNQLMELVRNVKAFF